MHRLATVHARDNEPTTNQPTTSRQTYLNKRLFYQRKVRRLKSCGKQESNVSTGVFWQTFATVYLSGNEFKRCHVAMLAYVITV